MSNILFDLIMKRIENKSLNEVKDIFSKELRHRFEFEEYQEKKINLLEIKIASIDDPDGQACAHCGGKNDFADDCGWFHIHDTETGIEGVCCLSCWKSSPGRNHVERYGLGER